MVSTDPVDTPGRTVAGSGDVIGGYLARAATAPESEFAQPGGAHSGEQDATFGVLAPGDQGLTGDSLVGPERAASGDAGSLSDGNRSAEEGGGSGGGSVSASDSDSRPITPVRESELGSLAAEVGHDTGIVERFAGDFLALLDERLESILSSLGRGDTDGAVVTLRSLETAAAMLGAAELARAAGEVRTALRHPQPDVTASLETLLLTADRFRLRLDQLRAGQSAQADQSGSASR